MSRAATLLARLKLWSGGGGRARARILPLDPAQGPIYAIGDIHGCRTLFRGLLARILEDAAGFPGTPTLVPLGDMVDRGPDSAGVLDDLAAPQDRCRIAPILGNHERMMLSFCAAPHGNLGWLDMGGFETLRSYGLALTAPEGARMPARRLAQTLAAHVPQRHLDWMGQLPHGYRLTLDGQAFVLVHAGHDPATPDAAQMEDTLIWGLGPARNPEQGPRVVHGHVVTDRPDTSAHRICIDTGAWTSGTLSALRLAPGSPPTLLCHRLQASCRNHPEALQSKDSPATKEP